MAIGLWFFMILILAYFISKSKEADLGVADEAAISDIATSLQPSVAGYSSALTYKGNELNLSPIVFDNALTKHFPYYQLLSLPNKQKFLDRLSQFIRTKTFLINATSGFIEMPILTSASAIQLTFGLEQFLLPGFPYINIYPDAFVGVYPTIRILEGNVSGNTINLSWKYLLDGVNDYSDGENLGVHEMSHALYYQAMVLKDGVDEKLGELFSQVDKLGADIYSRESQLNDPFFSSYALRNNQEFWAESVERFFEKPVLMKAAFPEYYEVICILLNQDPGALIIHSPQTPA